MKNDLEKYIEKEIDEAWEKELKDSISKKLNPILEKNNTSGSITVPNQSI